MARATQSRADHSSKQSGQLPATSPSLEEWLPASQIELRPSTYESYARNVRVHIVPRLGGVELQRLNRSGLVPTDLSESPAADRGLFGSYEQSTICRRGWNRVYPVTHSSSAADLLRE